MSEALEAPGTLVDHVIRACGGGKVLCVGPRAASLAREFRRRAVDATGDDGHDWTAIAPLLAACPSRTFDLVVVEYVLDAIEPGERQQVFAETLRVSRAAVLLRASGRTRLEWERDALAHGCRKHPLHQTLVPYQGLDWEGGVTTLLLDRLPDDLVVGLSVSDLASARDLHMDMLREGGRRADAHVARYMFARQFIRPGDRVLDAACGLGYGSAILTDGTLAESVEGIDNDAAAIDYATDHYGRTRSRLSFVTCDVSALGSRPAGSVDAIVSFETLEHIDDPEAFLATCRKILTPGGRLICSVPNEWLDERGVDPNPYHLQVFDRARLEQEIGRHFLIEHVYGQTAGGGMKLSTESRRLWRSTDHAEDAEWWLAVGMTDPVQPDAGPVRLGLTASPIDDGTNVLAFDRDYTHAWLARAMVTIGLRTESPELLTALANRVLATTIDASADAGAALCIRAYRYLDHTDTIPEQMFGAIDEYCRTLSSTPHVLRWQISLRYVEGLARLHQGDVGRARVALETCASSDALVFSPLLATKTVGASFLLGWMSLQIGDVTQAAEWWTRGIADAERALHRPWGELLLDRTAPALFGLREAATIVDLASQCASGLALLDQARERPGVVASQIFESLHERVARATRALERPVRSPLPGLMVAPPADEVQSVSPDPEPAAAPEPPSWRLLDDLDRTTLTFGEPDQRSVWDAEIDGEYSRNLFLHPPAILEARIPFSDAGRLTAKVALHPAAWGQPGASGCHFTITIDSLAETSVLLDPHAVPAHRHWIELTLHVPATGSDFHTLTLETRSVDAPDYGWALFRDVTFEPAIAPPVSVPVDAPAVETDESLQAESVND